MIQLNSHFFSQPSLDVAQDLLGKVFSVYGISGIVNETEAYLPDDPASHSFGGKTQRNAAMFAKPGTLYVYRSYGIHFCVNVATEAENVGAAVLLRGVIPQPEHIETIRTRRGTKVAEKNLCNGPGKLTQAFAITLQHNGVDATCSEETGFFDCGIEPKSVIATPRIGISKNTEKLWRFVGEL